MKRKVIQIANSTQLISLPRKWSQKYGVKKGDEIEVEENGGTLLITTERDISSSKTEIDFKGKDYQLIHRALSSLYRSGYDEIRIIFEKHSELEAIQSTINQELIGFEIVEEGKDHLIAKQVSNIEHSEFDSMLRRTFIFLMSTADESLEALKTNNVNALKKLILRDITINKLTDYCRRSLNKKENYFKHIGPGYTIIEFLEKIGDSYRDISIYASQNNIKINKLFIEAFSEINILLKDAYKLFYKFNLNEMEKFLIKKDNIDKAIINLSKNIAKNEMLLIMNLSKIAYNIFYLNGPLLINNL
ncbi:phosphate uptake regulator PhoU [Candidatus Woesearchaeota archaeon]|nr:phosphate uptake regulator PhoU [Candidatus Woesearchaeota archaeon]